MLKVAEIRVDGLLLEKRVNSLALRSCSVVPRIPAVAVECGIQTQYYLASPVCIPLCYMPNDTTGRWILAMFSSLWSCIGRGV